MLNSEESKGGFLNKYDLLLDFSNKRIFMVFNKYKLSRFALPKKHGGVISGHQLFSKFEKNIILENI